MNEFSTIAKCMQSGILSIEIIFIKYQDPSDGEVSLGAIVKDTYTKEVLIKLDWYYEFKKLVGDLDKRCEAKFSGLLDNGISYFE